MTAIERPITAEWFKAMHPDLQATFEIARRRMTLPEKQQFNRFIQTTPDKRQQAASARFLCQMLRGGVQYIHPIDPAVLCAAIEEWFRKGEGCTEREWRPGTLATYVSQHHTRHEEELRQGLRDQQAPRSAPLPPLRIATGEIVPQPADALGSQGIEKRIVTGGVFVRGYGVAEPGDRFHPDSGTEHSAIPSIPGADYGYVIPPGSKYRQMFDPIKAKAK